MALNKIKSIEKEMIPYFEDGGKYQEIEQVDTIISKIKNFEVLLQVYVINLRHQELTKVAKEEGDISLEETNRLLGLNIHHELGDSTKFGSQDDLETVSDSLCKDFIYIDEKQIRRWISGEDFI